MPEHHAADMTHRRPDESSDFAIAGIPLELFGLLTPLPTDRGPVAGDIVEHQAHAIGHAVVLLADRGVLLSGDMLSDVLIRWAPTRRHSTGWGGCPPHRSPGPRPPRRRSCLHRRAVARRGTSRCASWVKTGLSGSQLLPTSKSAPSHSPRSSWTPEVGITGAAYASSVFVVVQRALGRLQGWRRAHEHDRGS